MEMEAQHGELTAVAMCLKDFASLAEPAFAEMQILLRDELINQITGGESVAKSDLDVAFTGHSSPRPPQDLPQSSSSSCIVVILRSIRL